MSIKPPSDILLDVARAADPAKSAVATERLLRLASGAQVGDAKFTDVLGAVDRPRATPLPALPDTRFAAAASPKAKEQAETKAYQGIEALLLETLVENMMPQSEEFFGSGAGSPIWRSMLAQELGTALSKSVNLGLGPKHLEAERIYRGWRPVDEQQASLVPLRSAKHA